MAVESVLLDVGGTLWPDQWTPSPGERQEKVARLRAIDSNLEEGVAAALVDALDQVPEPSLESGAQNTNDTITAVLRDHGVTPGRLDAVAVRRAVSLPFAGRHKLLAGAASMVQRLWEDGMRLTVISNTIFRDAHSYWGDFAAAGLDRCLSGIVTSVDVGWRKPQRTIFDAALAITGLPPARTAIVGNSETSDILPALDLGMIAVLVAIEEPAPIFSSADAVVTSLEDVPAVLGAS